MIGYEDFPKNNILYKQDENGIKKAITYLQPDNEGSIPETKMCTTSFIDVDMDLSILKNDLEKHNADKRKQFERKEFVINYAEGIRNLDMANYSVAVACFEKAIRYKPEDHTAQDYLKMALRGEMNDINRRMINIRNRLVRLDCPNNNGKVKKCTVKMPVFAQSDIVTQGLLDSNGLIKHFNENPV
jgi:hypothetical protein